MPSRAGKRADKRAARLAAHLARRDCSNCAHSGAGVVDIEDAVPPPPATSALLGAKDEGLPRQAYLDPALYQREVARLFHAGWIFVGHASEVPGTSGAYLGLTVAGAPVVILRQAGGGLAAYHNVCRHRGAQLVSDGAGLLPEGERLTCPYHQWTYSPADGRLLWARGRPGIDPAEYALLPVHLEEVEGLLFACLAPEAPPFAQFREEVAGYLRPYQLGKAAVAARSAIVQRGNWKLALQHSRESFRRQRTHPELRRTFPADWDQSGGAEHSPGADELGLTSASVRGPQAEYRVMRHALEAGATSMTLDGLPAVARNLSPLLPRGTDIGNVALHRYPNFWSHCMADHAVLFRVLPLGMGRTEVTTLWLVASAAVAGVDYTLARLQRVWLATTRQDRELVERVQRGVASPRYLPGPLDPAHETGVAEFVGWYRGRVA